MRKQYSDQSVYNDCLQQLDKDIISNRKQKKQTRDNLLLNIDNMRQPSKKLGRLKYVSSFAIFMVLLFLGYQLFASDMTLSNKQASTVPQDDQTEEFFIVTDSESSEEEEVIDRRGDVKEGISEETTEERITYKPSEQEIAELDIPVNLNYSSKDDVEPDILISESEEGKTAIAWIHTDTNPIMVSEWTYTSENIVDAMVKEAASWHAHYDVEIVEFKGNPMVVSNKGDGFFEIHIITSEKLFTVGGAEKDVLLSIAEEINIK